MREMTTSWSWFGPSLIGEIEVDDNKKTTELDMLINGVVAPDNNTTCDNTFDYVADNIGETTMADNSAVAVVRESVLDAKWHDDSSGDTITGFE